jgi:hypothetical protein
MRDVHALGRHLVQAGERFFEHTMAVVVGFVLMIVGLAMGVTIVLLPIGVPMGLVGLLLFISGLTPGAFRRQT